jgi:hypothetical protein
MSTENQIATDVPVTDQAATDPLEKKIGIVEKALGFLLNLFLSVRSIVKSGK